MRATTRIDSPSMERVRRATLGLAGALLARGISGAGGRPAGRDVPLPGNGPPETAE